MDLDELYTLLQRRPRDGRWLMRRLGPDYPDRLEELRRQGRPVGSRLEEVEGARRLVYRADVQRELFTAAEPKRTRPRRKHP